MPKRLSVSRILSVLFVLLVSAFPLSGLAQELTWTQKFPARAPTPRHGHAMAYDPIRQQVVLFGGADNAGSRNDTWVWDGVNWTQVFPAISPSPRHLHAMAYDVMRQEIVLFGGEPPFELSDTWVWNGTNWLLRLPSTSPPGRSRHAMVYDTAHSQVMLFGGITNLGALDDTWTWNGADWAPQFPANKPRRRHEHAMAYDAARGEVLLFGGVDVNILLSDTWIWNGSDWTPRSPANTPSPRSTHAMAYDAARGTIVLFGGFDNNPLTAWVDETWTWNGTDWMPRSPPAKPSARGRHAMIYDVARSQVMLFGGLAFPAVEQNDTWVWGPETSAPIIDSVSPTSGTQGETIPDFTVNGSNFDANAILSFSGAGITVNSYSSRTATQISASITIATDASVGTRDVFVTNPDGQQAVKGAGFGVLVAPACDPLVADAGPDRTVRSGDFVMFDYSQSSCIRDVTDIQWDFGDGQVSSRALVHHRFSEPGTYQVRLTVKDSFGRSATDTAVITVEPVRVTVSFSETDIAGIEHSARVTAIYVWVLDVANGPLYSVREVKYEAVGVVYAQLFILASAGDLLTFPNGCIATAAIAQKFVRGSSVTWKPGVDVFAGSALAIRAFFFSARFGPHGPAIPTPRFECPLATFAP